MPALAAAVDWLAAMAAALAGAGPAPRVILHPAAHPVPPARIPGLVAAVGGAPAGVPAVAVSDTMKAVRDGVVVRTVPRTALAEVRDPWIFRRDALEAAIGRARRAGWRCADPLDLCRQAGVPVRILPAELAWPPA